MSSFERKGDYWGPKMPRLGVFKVARAAQSSLRDILGSPPEPLDELRLSVNIYSSLLQFDWYLLCLYIIS